MVTRYSTFINSDLSQSLPLDNWSQVESLKIPAVSVNILPTALFLQSGVQVRLPVGRRFKLFL